MAHLHFDFKNDTVITSVESNIFQMAIGLSEVMKDKPDLAIALVTAVLRYAKYAKLDLGKEQQRFNDMVPGTDD